jgi:hypothetical protein
VVFVLSIAAEITPDNPVVWYDLASLRQDPEYQRLLAILEPRKPNP